MARKYSVWDVEVRDKVVYLVATDPSGRDRLHEIPLLHVDYCTIDVLADAFDTVKRHVRDDPQKDRILLDVLRLCRIPQLGGGQGHSSGEGGYRRGGG
jgi:hypothetical protein